MWSVCLRAQSPETKHRKWNVLQTALKIYDVELMQRAERYGLAPDALFYWWDGVNFHLGISFSNLPTFRRWYLTFKSSTAQRRMNVTSHVKMLTNSCYSCLGLKRWLMNFMENIFPKMATRCLGMKRSSSSPALNVLFFPPQQHSRHSWDNLWFICTIRPCQKKKKTLHSQVL